MVFASPDFTQQRVREYALVDGKVLVMASPRLKHGFVVVDPKRTEGSANLASTIGGAFRYGKTVSIRSIPKPDLIVEGSVAVDIEQRRLGKGGGYGDMEIRTLRGLFGDIPVVTTIHDEQIVKNVPFEDEDEKASLIITPTRTVRVK